VPHSTWSDLVLDAILSVLFVLTSVLLIVLVLLHSGKDSGMASVTGFSFASSASVMERNLTRYTIIAGIVWFLLAFLLVWRLG
jgi:preprotein translocase subunit SecG